MPWLEPVTIEGERLRLEPIEHRHMERLVKATDAETFRYFTSYPNDWTPRGFEDWIRTRTPEPYLTLVMVNKEDSMPVGCSAFFDVKEKHKSLEIGYTWISSPYRGTWVNPEAKLLMVGHAIETLGAVRVQLKCDAKNERSRAAILKLGAKFEGILRNQAILPDGKFRDTAYFSILPGEWPDVKDRLEARLRR